MTESKTIDRRGGKRPGAGRPRKNPAPATSAPTPSRLIGDIDPIRVLEQIAGDESAPSTARVSAARALLVARAGIPAEAPEPGSHEIQWIRKDGAHA